VGEGKYKIIRPGSDKAEDLPVPRGKVTPGGCWGSFIAAVRAGNPDMANGDALTAHRSCLVGHLMNNSYRLGEQVPFDKRAGKFGDNKDAAEHFAALHDMMANEAGIGAIDGAKYTVGPMLEFDAQQEKFVGNRANEANQLLRDKNNSNFAVPEVSAV
jgi:hypothetical protein